MNKLQTFCGIAALVAAAGCKQQPIEYVTGTVIHEEVPSRSVRMAREILGTWFNDPTYILQIDTPEGVYTATLHAGEGRTLEAMDHVIEEGSRVRIRESVLHHPERFGEDRIGYLYTHEITVLDRE
mgnify:CR=1 FL=1